MCNISEGLREKKHLETRLAVELAAVDLVQQSGVADTTVERISERANISRRTFFNYYDCKEDAVLGLSKVDSRIGGGCQYNLLAGESAIDFLVRSLLGMFEHGLSNVALKRRRIALIRHNPCLLDRQLTVMSKMSKGLVEVAHQIISDQAQLGVVVTKAQAEVVLMLCFGAVKVSVKDWLEAGQKMPYKNINLQATRLVKEAIGVIDVKAT